MDAAELRVFEAVARLGGMVRAGAELNMVQSNVTARVRQLEARLGVALFTRHPRGVEPTAAGRRLLPYARRVARLLEDARRAVLDDGTPQGALVIGSLETTAALRLCPVLTGFVAACPAVDLTLRTGTSCEMLARVLAQELEGAFVCGPVSHPDLEVEPICTEELVLLSAAGVRGLDALARGGCQVRIVVLRAGCSYRQRLEDLLARRGVPAPRVLEFGTLEAIFASVSAGLGVSLLPRALVGPVVSRGRLAVHRLPARDATVETVFVRRRDAHRSSALSAFLDRVRAPATAAPMAAE